MKRILFLVPHVSKKSNLPNFFERFQKACIDKKIVVQKIILNKTIFILDKKGILQLFQNDEKITLANTYIFTRQHARQGYITSLIYDLAQLKNIPHNDAINRYQIKSQKPNQLIQLSHAKIPYPPSIICSYKSYTANKKTILKHIKFPLVLKAEGERGEAVWKINTITELERKLFKIKDTVILQTYFKNNGDLRILVYKDKIIGAIERKSADGFYNNLSKGGHAKKISLTNTEKRIAKKCCKILELDFAGVDIIRTKQGPFVIEVNKSPMIKGFEETTKIDVVKEIVNYLHKNSL